MQRQMTGGASENSYPSRGERHVTVLLNAGVGQRGRNGLCRIRNVSASGLAIETSLPLHVGEEAVVTLTSGQEVSCIVRWTRDGRTGMSCSVDMTTALVDARAEQMAGQAGPALPRFYPIAATTIRRLGRLHRCTLDSLSTRDILLQGAPALEKDEHLSVVIDGLGEFPALVCICDEGDLFARFVPPLPFHKMDEWLASQP